MIEYKFFYKFYRQILIDNKIETIKLNKKFYLKESADLFRVPLEFFKYGDFSIEYYFIISINGSVVNDEENEPIPFNPQFIRKMAYHKNTSPFSSVRSIQLSKETEQILQIYHDLC